MIVFVGWAVGFICGLFGGDSSLCLLIFVCLLVYVRYVRFLFIGVI